MLKGTIFGVSIAVFITSSILTIAGLTNSLKENLITGAVIGSSQFIGYSAVVMLISGVATLLISKSLIK